MDEYPYFYLGLGSCFISSSFVHVLDIVHLTASQFSPLLLTTKLCYLILAFKEYKIGKIIMINSFGFSENILKAAVRHIPAIMYCHAAINFLNALTIILLGINTPAWVGYQSLLLLKILFVIYFATMAYQIDLNNNLILEPLKVNRY